MEISDKIDWEEMDLEIYKSIAIALAGSELFYSNIQEATDSCIEKFKTVLKSVESQSKLDNCICTSCSNFSSCTLEMCRIKCDKYEKKI